MGDLKQKVRERYAKAALGVEEGTEGRSVINVRLWARRVTPGGKAYGLDMTDEMLKLARRNRAETGVENAEFWKGEIKSVPFTDEHVDVIISNCVINLSTEKERVIREAFRVLKPGGRFAVSDVVSRREKRATEQGSTDASR